MGSSALSTNSQLANPVGSGGWAEVQPSSGSSGRVLPSCMVQLRESSNPAADAAMERYANGDEAAFGELYDALVPRLYAFVLRKMRDPVRAEDLVQQTMLQVHCARGRFVPGS